MYKLIKKKKKIMIIKISRFRFTVIIENPPIAGRIVVTIQISHNVYQYYAVGTKSWKIKKTSTEILLSWRFIAESPIISGSLEVIAILYNYSYRGALEFYSWAYFYRVRILLLFRIQNVRTQNGKYCEV